MDTGRRAQVAEELPLAEIRAVADGQRRARKYTVIWRVLPEDVKAMDAFLNGPSGEKVVLMSIRTLPADWEQGPVDPEQGEDELDTISRLNTSWETMIELMRTNA